MPWRFAYRQTGQRAKLGLRLAVGLWASWLGEAATAQEPPSAAASSPTTVQELAGRLERLEAVNDSLSAQNQQMARQLQELSTRYEELSRQVGGSPAAALPVPASSLPAQGDIAGLEPSGLLEVTQGATTTSTGSAAPLPLPAPWPPAVAPSAGSRFLVGEYDDERGQFVLVRPRDPQRVPYEVRLDLFTQARYTYFAPSQEDWTDSTGQTLPIREIDTVEVTRNFVQFQGFALDPRLQFTAILFSSTALNDTVYLGWINYQFSRALDVRVGNWVIPGTREWYESFRWTMGADRLMATTFFRPNISPGIWAQGEPVDNVHYVAMVANSLNRFTQGIERAGSSRAFGGSLWWEPQGDFGVGPSDLENHARPSWRLGLNTAISSETNQGFGQVGLTNPEDTIVRLSDGTPLFRRGSLGPGVELMSTNIQLWTIDAALKYRGLGIAGEYFFRSLNGFETEGAQSAVNSLFDHGGLLQASYFLVARELELFARTSYVTGRFGTGSEYGAGVNWYPQGQRTWRYTFEVLRINDSPAQNLLTGYRAGETGTLFQLQWFTDF